ncbi:cytosolic sulfotransferase 12-like [Syzygium oleosum]|uniref:cytosolic sulfotransferase 12-like n=1 Tax=Syzygium oleosum TaxID=219896 RepID=UPI0011D1F50B|nr:cytosolic sulfotransferase 12-like [Syzygium oleosum]
MPQSPSLPKYLQEDDISQECRDLLPSLPREQGWVGTSLHLYQGFWVGPRYLKGALAYQRHFKARDPDILLVTTPKSGTTWLKAILFALLNRTKYSGSGLQRQHPLLSQNPHDLVPFLELKLYLEQDVPDLASLPPPRLFATHLSYQSLPQSLRDSSCKLVYSCRNPKDTFVSLWHFANKLRSKDKGENLLQESLDRFCRGVSLFGPYWDQVLGYHKVSSETPEKMLFLKYEDMKENPCANLRRLAGFLECPFSEEELREGTVDEILRLCSFDNLSGLEANKSGKLVSGEENKSFFRRGEVGDWVNYLSVDMAERIDHVVEEKLHGSGLRL